MPHPPDDPACLTPDQRRREVAAILAKGLLRLPQFPPESAESDASASDSTQKGLELSARPGPHVTAANAAEIAGGGTEWR